MDYADFPEYLSRPWSPKKGMLFCCFPVSCSTGDGFMKKVGFLAAALSAVVMLATATWADEPLKSGPQVGQDMPGPFHPLNVTGDKAGEKNCLYCANGAAPVAVIFARELNPNVTKLIKKIDACTIKNKKASMGSFVVFLSNRESLAKELKAMAAKESIKTTILSIDNPAGPKDYKIAKDADVTVLLYTDFTVKSNHAFRKGELNEKAINQIVSNVAKILPKN
jgi:hypothetical protein